MISKKITPKWGYAAWGQFDRIIGKPGRVQRQELLLEAVRIARNYAEQGERPTTRPGVSLHHEGGRAFDRHARRMVRDGLLKMERYAFKQSSHGGSNDISWSVLVPTEKGFAEADKLMKKAA